MNYLRGSEWRKWDLHVHTPASIIQGYGGDNEEVWEKFISDLESLPKEFKVIGINDYLFLDGYEKVLEYKRNGRLKNIDLILPVLEFRIEKFAGVDFGNLKRINLHIIFSNELKIETIKSQFLNALEQSYKIEKDGSEWSRSITIESLKELGKKIKESIPQEELSKYGSDLEEGFNNINVDENKIFELLNKDCFKGKYLVAIGKTEWCSLKWSKSSIPTKKTIINKADIVFTAAESIDNWQRSKEKLTQQKVNDLLLDCSDAHHFSASKEKDKIGNCFTWIKADTTFEGLKQIIYEPEERVRIQEKNPSFEYDKPYFKEIVISDDIEIFNKERLKFKKGKIPLNKNLVAIIGGRGTGKSMLINYLASIFCKYGEFSGTDSLNRSVNFEVIYSKNNQENPDIIEFKGDKENALDFIFLEQQKLKTLSRKEKLWSEMKQMLNIGDLQFNQHLNNEIQNILKELQSSKDWFDQKDENGNQINNEEWVKHLREENQKKLSLITTKDNKEKLERYIKGISILKKIDNLISDLRYFEERLKVLEKEINSSIEQFNLEEFFDREDFIEKANFETQLRKIKTLIEKLNEKKEENEFENKKIEKQFEDSGYKGDLKSLLERASQYQQKVEWANKKLKEIEDRKALLKNLLNKRSSLGNKIKQEYERQKREISDAWKSVINKIQNKEQRDILESILFERGIRIEGKINFDENKFYKILKNYFDMRYFKNSVERIKESLKIKDFDSYTNFIENSLSNYVEGPEKDKLRNGATFEKVFFDINTRSKYLRTIPEITYNGKSIDKLSAGQRGTLYLCIKLATSAFSTPIVLDQPEDDLDNQFIVDDLIGIFKKLKRFRQIIIITHNANLVVNTDAEQIIVANNESEELSYFSGSLENPIIIKNVCEILEGGEQAFEQRKNKYGF